MLNNNKNNLSTAWEFKRLRITNKRDKYIIKSNSTNS